MGRQLAEHPCTFASTFESCSFHVKQSKQSARRRIVKTKVAKKTFRATVGPFILAERLRLRMPTAKGRIAVFPRGVLCTFWPQKVPKTPRRMPSPTSSRLTFETGARLKGGFKGRWAAERVISDTTLSLLKPASYAGTFSRDFVSRLRHRNGTVRRETRREGCVRDKQEAQKPTIAPGSGFQPPHSRLERKKNNRQPACPEREAVKA